MGYAERNGKFPDGEPKWRAKWTLPERTEKGRRKEGNHDGFRSEDEAREYARDQEALIRAGAYLDPNAGKIALTDYFELWLSIQNVRPGTKLTYRHYFNREIKPTWGGTPLIEIKTVRLMQWLNGLNDPKSPRRLSRSGISLVTLILNGMFTLAAYEDRIRKSPIPPPSAGGRPRADYKPERKGQVFTRDEFAALLMNVPTWMDVVFIVTMLFTGTRWSEATAIRRRDLTLRLPSYPGDPISGTYLINPYDGALTKGEDYSIDFAMPKSGEDRLLDLAPFHVILLADWLNRIPAKRDKLFCGPKGGVLRSGDFGERVWRPCCDGRPAGTTSAHGVVTYPAIPAACPGKVPHDLKHTCKSIMSDARVDEIMQNYALGHKEQGSSGPYKHPTPKMRQERLDALQGAWTRWAIDLTKLPAWSANDGPGAFGAISAPEREPRVAVLGQPTPELLQVDQDSLF